MGLIHNNLARHFFHNLKGERKGILTANDIDVFTFDDSQAIEVSRLKLRITYFSTTIKIESKIKIKIPFFLSFFFLRTMYIPSRSSIIKVITPDVISSLSYIVAIRMVCQKLEI